MSVYGETPSGAVNGSNRVFTTSQPYFAGSTRVFVNGVRTEAYTESAASQITFTTAPANGAIVLVDYDITAGGTNYPVGEWTFEPEGYPAGAALYNGPTLFLAGVNPGQTQTAVAVFGPGGAQIQGIPAVFAGPAGQPALFDSIEATPLAPGSNPTATPTLISPGGAGLASHYGLVIGVPSGQPGAAAANTLISPQPSDLEGSPLGGYYIGYNPTDAKAEWLPIPVGGWINVPRTSIANTGATAGQTRTIQPLTITGVPFAWIPIVLAKSVITGTANTQVDIVARIGGALNTQNGVEVARGNGQIGAITGTNPWRVNAIPDFPGLLTASPPYGQVAAGAQATILLNAEQQAATTDQYTSWRNVVHGRIAAIAAT